MKKSIKLANIFSIVKKDYVKYCDDAVKCQCGKQERSAPEWKHQVRWVIHDLKYANKITYNKEQNYILSSKNRINHLESLK